MEKKAKKNYLKIAVIIVLGAILIGGMFHLVGERDKTADKVISGTVDINGITPQTGDEEFASLKLMYKTEDEEGFAATNADVPLQDGASWQWNEAIGGETYELRMDLYINDRLIKSSSVSTVTAPSDNVRLTLNVSIKDIPEAVIEDIAAVISGRFDLQGYLPEGSTVNLMQRVVGDEEFQTAVSDISAGSNAVFSWDKARNGREYEVKAQLLSGGAVIGESEVLEVVAPAENEVIQIKSSLEAPVSQAEVSGIINLRGPVEQNSTVLLLARTQGEEDFQTIDRLPAVSGTSFVWSEAVASGNYEITAALQVNEENVSTGNTLRITAPASNLVIVIDTNISLQNPSSAPTYSCGPQDATGSFNATIIYPQQEGAKKFYLEVGRSSGSTDILKKAVDVSADRGHDEIVFIPGNTDIFTRFAYTFCEDCNVSDAQNWSGFSPTLGFKCP